MTRDEFKKLIITMMILGTTLGLILHIARLTIIQVIGFVMGYWIITTLLGLTGGPFEGR